MEGLIIGRNLVFQNGLDLTTKTASPNSPWAYIREGLLSEGYLRLRFGGLIFGRAYFWGGLLSEFYGRSKTCPALNQFVAIPVQFLDQTHLKPALCKDTLSNYSVHTCNLGGRGGGSSSESWRTFIVPLSS